jgi:hypothetical protein
VTSPASGEWLDVAGSRAVSAAGVGADDESDNTPWG